MMRMRTGIFALAGLSLLVGCGGGNSATPPPGGRGPLDRHYIAVDLGTLPYYWPGTFLSPGAASISLNLQGQVVSAMNYVPFLWENGSVTHLTGSFTPARAINDTGQIAGDTFSPTSSTHAALWQGGKVTDLGSLNTDPNDPTYYHYSIAFGLNNKGDVVGESSIPHTPTNTNDWWNTHAFLSSEGKMTDLGSFGGYYCRAVSVNNARQVVGYGTLAGNQETHAFLWENGNFRDLGMLPGGTYSQANWINDKGQAVGFANQKQTDLFGTPPPRAALWENGKITPFGTLGGPGSYATCINNAGEIVGSAETDIVRTTEQFFFGYFYNYFTYYGYGWYYGAGNGGGGGVGGAGGGNGGGTGASGGAISPPGGGNSAGSGTGTNFGGGGNGRAAKLTRGANGKLTRSAEDGNGYFVAHGFLFANGHIIDLNDTLPATSGWEVTTATAINDNGQIVGIGVYKGQIHGCLLLPQAQ